MDADAPRRRSMPSREARNSVANYACESPTYLDSAERRAKRTKPNDVPSDNETTTTTAPACDDDSAIEVGNCVLVDLGRDYEGVAVVRSMQSLARPSTASTFVGQWFYRAEDIAPDILQKLETPVLQREVFFSTQTDRNLLKHVRGTCKVVSALDFMDRLNVIRQGHEIDSDDEEKRFICRFRYNPENLHQPFVELQEHEIRFNYAAAAKIGVAHQVGPLPRVETSLRERYLADVADRPHPRALHMWSPSTMDAHPFLFKKYLGMLDVVRYGVGNIVKTYRKASLASTVAAHVRGLVFAYNDDGTLGLITSDGANLGSVQKSDVTSVLTDDRAMHHFHATKCNVAHAMQLATTEYMALQEHERVLYRREVEINCHSSKVSLT
ncbi:hypothetical protein SPRG_22142 [Saprolegnia parasitica CBS 223.65]|uniref:BAH domain-containing protein n=1 Tax=Saprolegnia parasitica (strain CBS 223.65) TaxID=695850 RepID=A0A067CSR2_SAPPC|nr:hypothetical protein SPRG_22142 [Saprolegnia parasitica CBS 223.65]KDO29837.1 hypothetical protein SPRG_22142 [Saprolegnia parasitica CBS 223.65]|eukprot:XP_012199570.1 hypothetical protein SPRG_22142 [Saprolegnia parasitica CBS 223.65]